MLLPSFCARAPPPDLFRFFEQTGEPLAADLFRFFEHITERRVLRRLRICSKKRNRRHLFAIFEQMRKCLTLLLNAVCSKDRNKSVRNF
jgi:hypothetical protein